MNDGDDRFLVALPPVRELLFWAKHLFIRAMVAFVWEGRLSDGTLSAGIVGRTWPLSRWRKGALPVWQSHASKGRSAGGRRL
jgi:hypothetical protein